MSFNIPNTFVAGTKAKADEVNENFSSIENEINKENQNIVSIQEDLNYIKNEMMNDFVYESETIAKSLKSKFSVNYGNTDLKGTSADILSANENILNFKVGGGYPVLTVTNAYGDSETFEYLDEISVSGKADGNYNVFLNLDGGVELYNTRLFRTPKEPIGILTNDIWLMTLEPWCCYKFNGVSWVDYEGVLIGQIEIENGEISKVTNVLMNTQYLDSDCCFITKTGRENLSKRYETPWFDIAQNGIQTFEHNLNIDPLRYHTRLITRVKAGTESFEAGDILESTYSNFASGANAELGYLLKLSPTHITIASGNSTEHCHSPLGTLNKANLDYKLIITADIN